MSVIPLCLRTNIPIKDVHQISMFLTDAHCTFFDFVILLFCLKLDSGISTHKNDTRNISHRIVMEKVFKCKIFLDSIFLPVLDILTLFFTILRLYSFAEVFFQCRLILMWLCDICLCYLSLLKYNVVGSPPNNYLIILIIA